MRFIYIYVFAQNMTILLNQKLHSLIFARIKGKICIQGVPKNMGIQWRIRYRLCYELAAVKMCL